VVDFFRAEDFAIQSRALLDVVHYSVILGSFAFCSARARLDRRKRRYHLVRTIVPHIHRRLGRHLLRLATEVLRILQHHHLEMFRLRHGLLHLTHNWEPLHREQALVQMVR
jgi:hypothetical protein